MTEGSKVISDNDDVEMARYNRYINYLVAQVTTKARSYVRQELARGHRIPEEAVARYMASPKSWLSTVMVRIPMLKLYRRYKCVRIRTLSEVMILAQSNPNRDEFLQKLRHLIINAAESTNVDESVAEDEFTFSLDD